MSARASGLTNREGEGEPWIAPGSAARSYYTRGSPPCALMSCLSNECCCSFSCLLTSGSSRVPSVGGAIGMGEAMRRAVVAVALVVSVSHAGGAQARVLSAPPEPSLLNITRQWSRASSLGDLRELRTEPDYRELRVWLGFGLTTETQGLIVRRANGHWSAFFARVMRCEIEIPRSVGDTASRATMQRYTAEARRHCGTTVPNVTPGARVLTTDTLLVAQLSLPDSMIEAAWTAAERAGVSRLPPRVARSVSVDDAAVYVIELRNGNDYRASTIEQLDHPETEADQQVKDVYAALMTRLRTP